MLTKRAPNEGARWDLKAAAIKLVKLRINREANMSPNPRSFNINRRVLRSAFARLAILLTPLPVSALAQTPSITDPLPS